MKNKSIYIREIAQQIFFRNNIGQNESPPLVMIINGNLEVVINAKLQNIRTFV